MQSFGEKDRIQGAPPKKSKQKNFYQNSKYNINNYWKPGDAVTEEGEKLLAEVKNFYEKNGYTPSKEDISNSIQLKSMFRKWKNVLMAAELNKNYVISTYLSGLPVNAIHALATVLTLYFFSQPLFEKIDRLKTKYGMMEG